MTPNSLLAEPEISARLMLVAHDNGTTYTCAYACNTYLALANSLPLCWILAKELSCLCQKVHKRATGRGCLHFCLLRARGCLQGLCCLLVKLGQTDISYHWQLQHLANQLHVQANVTYRSRRCPQVWRQGSANRPSHMHRAKGCELARSFGS